MASHCSLAFLAPSVFVTPTVAAGKGLNRNFELADQDQAKLTSRRIFGDDFFQHKMNNHGSFFISFAYSSSQQYNVFVQMSPEKFRQCQNWNVRLYELNNVSYPLVIVAAGPEEGRVHQSSQYTDSWRRKASLGSRNCSAGVWITKIMASLSNIVTVGGTIREGKPNANLYRHFSINLRSGGHIVSSQLVVDPSNTSTTSEASQLLDRTSTLKHINITHNHIYN